MNKKKIKNMKVDKAKEKREKFLLSRRLVVLSVFTGLIFVGLIARLRIYSVC